MEIVRDGYDAMAPEFGRWAARIVDEPRHRFTAALVARLEPGAQVLDLGCGAGALAAVLAPRFAVHGVDISGRQLELARAAVPGATFEQADLTAYERDAAGVDAVCAFYCLTHVPRELHADVLARIRRWLRPGGWLLATLSAVGGEGAVQDDFVGVPMYFSGFDAETNRALVDAAGFERVLDEVVTIHEPDGDAGFLWVLAQKPA